MDDEDTKYVVIATTNNEKALFIIAKDAVINDVLEIRFNEKYAPTVEYILRIIRKGFGWLEIDRGEKNVENTKCANNYKGFCSNKDLGNVRCTESIRRNCKNYIKRSQNKMTVNYISIEKAGQIRGL